MKRQNSLVLLASVMLAAKPFAISEKEAVPLFGPECYHRNDYGFFYNNLKQNIADRIRAFVEK